MFGFAKDIQLLIGRIFIAAVFIYDGFVLFHNGPGGPNGGLAYVQNHGMPGWTWYLALLLELGGGALIVAGFFTRWVAAIFFVFCMMTAFFFQNPWTIAQAVDFSKAATAIAFGKDIGLAGGWLFLMAAGAGGFSLDKAIRGTA